MSSSGKLFNVNKCHDYMHALYTLPYLTPIDIKVTVSGITDAWRSGFTIGVPSLFINFIMIFNKSCWRITCMYQLLQCQHFPLSENANLRIIMCIIYVSISIFYI